MGIPKHGKESARTKSCKNYKDTGRLAINKAKKAEKIAAGKKINHNRLPKSKWTEWKNLIRNTQQSVPYCDPNLGVLWGVDKNADKNNIDKAKQNRQKRFKKSVEDVTTT